MNRQTFMSVVAGVSVISGLAALLAPAQVAGVFAVELDDVGMSVTRLLGAAYLGYAVIVWVARDIGERAARRAIALGNLASWAISLVVIVAGMVTNLAGAQSWSLVALAVVVAAGWGYLAFVDRTEAAPTWAGLR